MKDKRIDWDNYEYYKDIPTSAIKTVSSIHSNITESSYSLAEDKTLSFPKDKVDGFINRYKDHYKGISVKKVPIKKLLDDNNLLNSNVDSYHNTLWKDKKAKDFHIDMNKINNVSISDIPFIVQRKNGKYIIDNGKHRTIAAYNDGYDFIECPVYIDEDLSKRPTKSKFIIAYHGSQTNKLNLKSDYPLYATDSFDMACEFAKGYNFGYKLLPNETPTVYKLLINLNNPKYIYSEEEYDELMDISNWEDNVKELENEGYDGIIYTDQEQTYIMIFNPSPFNVEILEKTLLEDGEITEDIEDTEAEKEDSGTTDSTNIFNGLNKRNDKYIISRDYVENYIFKESFREIIKRCEISSVDSIPQKGPCFLLTDGSYINVIDLITKEDYPDGEYQDYLMDEYIDEKGNRNTHHSFGWFLLYRYATRYLKTTDFIITYDAVDYLINYQYYNWGLLKLNLGNTWAEDRFYAVLPPTVPTPIQISALQDYITYGANSTGAQTFIVFILDQSPLFSPEYVFYDLYDTTEREIINKIKRYYVSGVLLEDLDSSLMYHGSFVEGIDLLDSEINWVTPSYEYAKEYALGLTNKGYIYSCSVNPGKIFDAGNTHKRVYQMIPILPYKFSEDIKKIFSKLDLSEDEGLNLIEDVIKEKEIDNPFRMRLYTVVRSKAFKKILVDKGYNSIHAVESIADDHKYYDSYGIFTPIKTLISTKVIKSK